MLIYRETLKLKLKLHVGVRYLLKLILFKKNYESFNYDILYINF